MKQLTFFEKVDALRAGKTLVIKIHNQIYKQRFCKNNFRQWEEDKQTIINIWEKEG